MKLRRTTSDDLPFLLETEQRFSELGFVHNDNVCVHQKHMSDPDFAYYTVEEGDKPAGYIILRGLTSADCSVELKRIVIAEPGYGLGRKALRALIDKVFYDFRALRLWLDVFEDNHRARHVYRSLGFVEENSSGKRFDVGDRYRALVVMSMSEGRHRQSR